MISLLVSSRPRTGPHTTHPISSPKCVRTLDGSNKAVEVKVSTSDCTIHVICDARAAMSFVLFMFFASSPVLSGGFQGIPNSLRQPGPRANLRQMTPNSGSQGPRGVSSNITIKSVTLLLPVTQYIKDGLSVGLNSLLCNIQPHLRIWLLAPPWGSLAPAMCHPTNMPPVCGTPTLRWCSRSPSSRCEHNTSPVV